MNLADVSVEFLTDAQCRAYLERLRWPKGVECLRCKEPNPRRMTVPGKTDKKREIFECRACRYQFTVTAGTIFHDSHLPLRKWFLAIALMCESKKGISANQIRRALGVQYKTAWYLCHRIRKAMEAGDIAGKLGGSGGVVEVDETYIGGKYDRRRKRGPWEKPPVMATVERKGKVRTDVIQTPSKTVLVGKVREHVADDVRLVVTDELAAYDSVGKFFPHAVIEHKREYVRGEVHTNTVENFWSLLKRGIVGSFHKVSLKHLRRYLKEFSYRYNNRDAADLFAMTVNHLVTTDNMPYAELTRSCCTTVDKPLK